MLSLPTVITINTETKNQTDSTVDRFFYVDLIFSILNGYTKGRELHRCQHSLSSVIYSF